MKTIRSAIIVPSRGRPSRIDECMKSLLAHTVQSDIYVALDEDDHHNYKKYLGVKYIIGPKPIKLGVNEKLNRIANQLKNDYDYIMWAADDTVVLTPAWDKLLVDAIKDVPNGISYPDDLLQGERLPSNGTCFTTNIVRSLGYLAPPTLLHLYIDNYWKRLGETLGSLRYCSDVKLEHHHYVNKKAMVDPIYEAVNAQWMYEHDRTALALYYANDFGKDLQKLATL